MNNARFGFLVAGILVLFSPLAGQLPDRDTGQRYIISARLDPSSASLDATGRLAYIHPGDDTLRQMVFHIWANAFGIPLSAYGRQLLDFGKTDFYFTPAAKRVRYRELVFRTGGTIIPYRPWQDHPDVLLLDLAEPLAPGQRLELDFTFALELPGFHSRMGTDGEIWQMAHWFPKVARHDREGWHPTPYLEMGEFYQDFADYQITLTLPDSFTLVSTGQPSDDTGRAALREAHRRSMQGLPGMPALPGGTRTWMLEARWVPDFAWAASPAFLFRADTFQLADGRPVIGQVAHTTRRAGTWKSAGQALRQAILHYDRRVGPYPWPQASAVQGVRGFSGGMEYPMITFIDPRAAGQSLATVIAHEVGHNWFYGVLASNERREPWLDEGLNSYYDHLFDRDHPGGDGFEQIGIDPEDILLMDFAGWRGLPLPANGVRGLRSEIDYQLSAYTIPKRALLLLSEMVGESALDSAFQDYYRQWAFDHPTPSDMRASFEGSLGRDLGWFFEAMTGKPFSRDLKLRRARRDGDDYVVRVGNAIPGPLPWRLQQWSGDMMVASVWYPGFSGRDTTVRMPILPGVDRLSLLDTLVPDIRPGNNTLWLAPVFRRYRDWSPGFAFGLRNARSPRTYVLPLAGFNRHDGWQPGLALHNQKVHYQPSGYFLGLFYGVDSERWNHRVALYHDVYPGNGPARWRVALRSAAFGFFSQASPERHFRIHNVSPMLEWQSAEVKAFGVPLWTAGLYTWLLRHQHLDAESGLVAWQPWEQVLALRGKRRQPDALQPWEISMGLEYMRYPDAFRDWQSFLKAEAEARYGFQFMKDRWFRMRAFAGFFPFNSRRDFGGVSNRQARGSFALAWQGHNDYRYEEIFSARNTDGTFLSRQVYMRDGGFKTALGPAFGAGQSNDMLLAVNLWSGLPIPYTAPLKVYADLGYWSDRTPLGRGASFADQLWMDAGVKLSFWSERMEIFLPLWQNKPLNDLLRQQGGGWADRLSWSVRFDLLRLPWRPLSLI